MGRAPHEIVLAALDACGPDNEWAAGAAERLRSSPTPEVTAVIIEAELEHAAQYTSAAYHRWLSG